MKLIKKIFKWIGVLIGLLILFVIVSALYDTWEHTIDEEIAFVCDIEDKGDAKVRIILQSSPYSRDRKNYWDGGLILLTNASSANEEKYFQYLSELSITKINSDVIELKDDSKFAQYTINRENFSTTVEFLKRGIENESNEVWTANTCQEVEPDSLREKAEVSQEKVKGINKI